MFAAASVENVEAEGLSGGVSEYRLEGSAASGTLTYTVRPALDGPLYMELGLPELPSVPVSVNGGRPVYYATAQTNGSLYLGDFSAGEEVTVRLQAFSDISVTYAAFATEDEAALARYASALKEGGCPLEKLSSSHFAGAFTTAPGDRLLVLTLPYDGSWRVTLDGVRAQPVKVQDCLMAIPVSEGAHTLEMRYVPAGLIPGAAITAIALAACIAVFVTGKRKKQ